MKSNHFKILAVALALAVMAAIGVSQTVRHAHMRGDGIFDRHMLRYFARRLDLTAAQQAQLNDIVAKEKSTIQPLVRQIAQGHKQQREQVMSGSFDEAKVRELAVQQTQTTTELTVQKARIASELIQLLTPEQKTKLTELINQHEQRFMNHMQGETQGQTQSQ